MYKKVLIADDCEEEIAKLRDFFVLNGFDVVYAENPELVFNEIEKKDIDILILDWFFVLPSDNTYALEVINALTYHKYFIPVFVYSNKDSEEIIQEFPKNYPDTLVNAMVKPNPSDGNIVKNYIDDWFKKNPAVRLANNWYKSIQNAIGTTLEEMYTRIDKGVISLLNQTYRTEKDKGAADIISLIMSIVQYHLLQDSTLNQNLNKIIDNSNCGTNGEECKNYEAIRSFEMYVKTNNDTAISTGDIFLLDADVFNQEAACTGCILSRSTPVFAVAISAECDYAHSSQKLRYHKFILGKDLIETCKVGGLLNHDKIRSFVNDLANHNNEGYYYMPFVQTCFGESKVFENVVLDFQNIVAIVKDIHDPYFIAKRICKMRPIYYQHLSRRYSTFSGRIGVPDIPKQKISDITENLISKINPA